MPPGFSCYFVKTELNYAWLPFLLHKMLQQHQEEDIKWTKNKPYLVFLAIFLRQKAGAWKSWPNFFILQSVSILAICG